MDDSMTPTSTITKPNLAITESGSSFYPRPAPTNLTKVHGNHHSTMETSDPSSGNLMTSPPTESYNSTQNAAQLHQHCTIKPVSLTQYELESSERIIPTRRPVRLNLAKANMVLDLDGLASCCTSKSR
jgi:hypothetical protein